MCGLFELDQKNHILSHIRVGMLVHVLIQGLFLKQQIVYRWVERKKTRLDKIPE